MTAFQITISNDTTLFGGGGSSQWGAYNWGAFNWGEGTTDFVTNVRKLISADTTLFGGGGSSLWNAHNWGEFNWGEGTVDMITNVRKLITNSQASDSAINKQVSKFISDSSVTTLSGPSSERLMDSNGWYHTFISNTDEGEDRDFAEWTNITDDGETWVEVTVSTTWS